MTTSADVPARFHCAINGRPFLIDRASGQFRMWTQQVARTQADTGDKAGEQSLARELLWRRTMTSWHHGCGQSTYDDATGDPYRFRKSRGIDVFTTPGSAKPIGGLTRIATPSTNAGHIATYGGVHGQLLIFGGIPYVVGNTSGKNIYSAWDTTTSAASVPTGIECMCTDGSTVYIADGSGDIYTTVLGGGAATAGHAGDSYYYLAYTLGRLWGADATGVWNVTDVTAGTRTEAFTYPSGGWTVHGIVQGQGGVLVGGFDNSRASIYLVGLLPDGSGITAGYQIGELPEGEYLTGMHSYLGYVILGTSKGVRVCQHAGGANFTVGPLLDLFSTTANNGVAGPALACAVYNFASYDRFVYFGWPFYDWSGQSDTTLTSGTAYFGLGRIDLGTWLAPLQPAYCADTMRRIDNTDNHMNGVVSGVAVDKCGTPWFLVSEDELYGGTISGTPSKSTYARTTCDDPYLWAGKVILGVDDVKVPSALLARTSTDGGVGGGVTISVVEEDGTSTSLFTTSPTVETTTASLTSIGATQSLEPRLTWGSLLSSITPQTVFDVRIDAWPSPRRVQRLQLPLVIAATVATLDDGEHTYASAQDEVDALMTLAAPSGRAVVDVQLGTETWQMVVDDVDFRPAAPIPSDTSPALREWAGLCLVTLSRGLD